MDPRRLESSRRGCVPIGDGGRGRRDHGDERGHQRHDLQPVRQHQRRGQLVEYQRPRAGGQPVRAKQLRVDRKDTKHLSGHADIQLPGLGGKGQYRRARRADGDPSAERSRQPRQRRCPAQRHFGESLGDHGERHHRCHIHRQFPCQSETARAPARRGGAGGDACSPSHGRDGGLCRRRQRRRRQYRGRGKAGREGRHYGGRLRLGHDDRHGHRRLHGPHCGPDVCRYGGGHRRREEPSGGLRGPGSVPHQQRGRGESLRRRVKQHRPRSDCRRQLRLRIGHRRHHLQSGQRGEGQRGGRALRQERRQRQRVGHNDPQQHFREQRDDGIPAAARRAAGRQREYRAERCAGFPARGRKRTRPGGAGSRAIRAAKGEGKSRKGAFPAGKIRDRGSQRRGGERGPYGGDRPWQYGGADRRKRRGDPRRQDTDEPRHEHDGHGHADEPEPRQREYGGNRRGGAGGEYRKRRENHRGGRHGGSARRSFRHVRFRECRQ